MSCITYLHNDPFDSGGTKFISGTTCGGSASSYNISFGNFACMEAELPLIICDGLTISGSCSPATEYYFQPEVDICNSSISADTLDLTGYTLTFNGVNYNTLVGNQVDPSIFASYCAVGPAVMGTTGTTYRFDFVIDNPNYELCGEPFSGLTYDRIDIVLTSYLGETSPNIKEWIVIDNHYLNDVLVFSEPDSIQFVSYPTSENTNCPNVFIIFAPDLRFLVREKTLTTPTPTPTRTPTPTPTSSGSTPTPTPTLTQTPTQTSTLGTTPTQTPTPSPTPAIEIFTHGTVLETCSDFCNANYQIDVSTGADANFASLTIGDTIYNQGGVAGFVAYAATSTDTATGTFRIAQINTSGEILAIFICIAGNCEVL